MISDVRWFTELRARPQLQKVSRLQGRHAQLGANVRWTRRAKSLFGLKHAAQPQPDHQISESPNNHGNTQ